MRWVQGLFLLFVLVPIAEIWLLIQVGGHIGGGWTIFLVVLTAVLGAAIVRFQGLTTLARVRALLAAGELPAVELLEGLGILVAGALLLTPGFITDCAGFALLFPPLRRALAEAALRRGLAHGHGRSRTPEPPGGRTLDGDFRRLDDD